MVYYWTSLAFIFVSFICLIDRCVTLHISYLHVPHTAWREVQIDCKYNLTPEEKLYDVKWYKDEQQFFRCSADGSVQKYDVTGVNILSSSISNYVSVGSCPVTLTALDFQSSGIYQCEVSLDYPSFNLTQKQQELRVSTYQRQFQDKLTEAAVEDKGTQRQGLSAAVEDKGSQSQSFSAAVEDNDSEKQGLSAAVEDKGSEKQSLAGSTSNSIITFVIVFFVFMCCSF